MKSVEGLLQAAQRTMTISPITQPPPKTLLKVIKAQPGAPLQPQ